MRRVKVEVGFVVGKVSAFDMDALDSRIRELVAFARERDGEDRTTLFRSLVDMFLTGKAPVREPTRGQLLDVIEALIPHVEPDSRKTVAEILARQTKPPMDLVRRLARDRARLMEILLLEAPFDEDDIIDLIASTGREHHQILAARSDLSANVWIALARAAPSAPPFERQSSLALWRDDLGAHEAQAYDTENLEELEEFAEPRRAVAGGGSVIAGGMGSDQHTGTPPVATVMRLHPEGNAGPGHDSDKKPSSLRILKTDEDLIAERMSERPSLPETRMVRASQNDDAETGHNLTRPQEDVTDVTDVTGDAGSDGARDDAPRFLRDPGPGGWAWRSDRDGFIKLVSPYAARLFGGSNRVVGMAMLDMLGLNTKLDHPVSRAFQRRSTIHDAPINLSTFGDNHQYWTLEAAPVFSACGGVFEGFEGILTPVVPAKDEPANTDTSYDQPLFLDEDDGHAAPSDAVAAGSILDKPSVLQSSYTFGEEKSQPEPRKPAGEAHEKNPLADMINNTAAALVREAVADALTPLSPGEEEKRYGRQDAPKQDAPDAMPPEEKQKKAVISPPVNEEINATLSLLEEALLRLTDAGEKGAAAQVRLQADIAQACLRALKQQLSKTE